jgi:hypothetical protein
MLLTGLSDGTGPEWWVMTVGEIADTRARWLEVARQVYGGQREGLLCPENQDAFLTVLWVPFRDVVGGEYWLRCPGCGAHNELLVRHEHNGPA